MAEGSANRLTGNVWTFQGSSQPPPPPPPPPPPLSPQSGKMSLYPKWAGAVPAHETHGGKIRFWNPPTGRAAVARTGGAGRTTTGLKTDPDKYCSSINTFLFRWGQFCNFLLTKKKIAKIFAGQPVSIFARPVGPWWRVASLYIHTRGRLEDNAEAAPSIPSPHSLICISMTHREHFAF